MSGLDAWSSAVSRRVALTADEYDLLSEASRKDRPGSAVYMLRAIELIVDGRRNLSPTGCHWCGRDPAEGLASIGDRRYCHGDHDPEPTCYQMAQWVNSDLSGGGR